jgi:integrase
MAIRNSGRFTALQVDALGPGLHSDSNNLYLRVKLDGRRSWAFIYRINGKQREAGLGKAADKNGKNGVTLANARRRASEGREMLGRKPPVDPLTVWRARPASDAPTFAEAADAYVRRQESRGEGGRNPKHRRQWKTSLASLPAWFRALKVDQIGPQQVFDAIDDIWSATPESGSRLRGRIAGVLDSARGPEDVRPNPASLTGWLKQKLGDLKELGKIDRKTKARVERGNFAAMHYRDVPAFAARLRAEHVASLVPARGLEFLLLTAARTGEAIGAKWSEMDLTAGLWTMPPERLKTGRKVKKPHVVPLSDRALEIVKEMRAITTFAYVFPGFRDGRPLDSGAFLELLRRMGYADVTIHGFRSSFRDWAGDQTPFSREIAEAALGHVVTGVEGVYRRGDALAKRRELMDVWAAYCTSTPSGEAAAANVLPFSARAS